MDFKIEDWVIDFDRVNELTTTSKDSPDAGPMGTYYFSTSKKIVKDYVDKFIDFYLGQSPTTIRGRSQSYTPQKSTTNTELEHITKTLIWNRILVDRSDSKIRDEKLDKIL
jgi:hypothetical protein